MPRDGIGLAIGSCQLMSSLPLQLLLLTLAASITRHQLRVVAYLPAKNQGEWMVDL